MTTKRFLILVALMVLLAPQHARGMLCVGVPGGTGDSYSVGRPILHVSYNPLTGKTYMTDDLGAGRVWEGESLGVSVLDNNAYPQDIVVIPGTNLVFYALSASSVVKVYDLTQGRAINTIPVGSSPHGLAYSSVTKKMYVANSLSNNVSVIDLNPASSFYQRVIKTISVGAWPWTVAVNETRGRVYVGNRNGQSLSVIREDLLSVMGTIYLGFRPAEITANKSTNKVYVVNELGSAITVVNGNTDPGVVQTTFTAGSNPWGIVVNPLTGSIFITDNTDQTVMWFKQDAPPDGASYTLFDTYALGTAPRGIDVDQATDHFIVGSEDGVLFDGLPPCDRRNLDKCVTMRTQGLVNDAAVESFMECYFHQ